MDKSLDDIISSNKGKFKFSKRGGRGNKRGGGASTRGGGGSAPRGGGAGRRGGFTSPRGGVQKRGRANNYNRVSCFMLTQLRLLSFGCINYHNAFHTLKLTK